MEADALRTRFRDAYLKGLLQLHREEGLRLTGDWSALRDRQAFEYWLSPLREIARGVHLQGLPVASVNNNRTSNNRTDNESTIDDTAVASPERVLKYLARYLTGGPISDRRLVSDSDGRVTFLARPGNTPGGTNGQQPVELDGVKFLRRWCLHILPAGFVKSRCFGGFSTRSRAVYLSTCRELLPTPAEATEPVPLSTPPPVDDSAVQAAPTCPHCQQAMEWVASIERPSWHDVIDNPTQPSWYLHHYKYG